MGSIYRKSWTDPKTRTKKTSRTWYIAWVDEHGNRPVENTGTGDRALAQQMLAAKERRVSQILAGVIDPAIERVRDAGRLPPTAHLDDYAADLANRGRSADHIATIRRHITALIEILGLRSIADLTPEAAQRFVRRLQTAELDGTRGLAGRESRNPRTVNSYIVSVKSFYRWLAKTSRVTSNPVANLAKLPEDTDRRHDRRAMSAEEFVRLFQTADSSPLAIQGIDGPTRATIYLVAAMTGLRRKELASLTREDFRLDDPTPFVRILGAYSKNKKTDEIPLHPDVVARLREYFDRTQPADGQPVFPIRIPAGGLRSTSRMMQHDCKAAGIDYKTTDGFVDFHANRVLFITSLCRNNVNLVMAQKLARHSDPKLTANVYSKVSTEERAAAVNSIQSMPISGSAHGSARE